MADESNNRNGKPDNRELIFDWKNPSMSTTSTSRMQEDARRAREEARKAQEEYRSRHEQTEADVLKERREELLEKRRAGGRENRGGKTPLRRNAPTRSPQASGRRTAPRPAGKEKTEAPKLSGGISLSPAWIRRGLIAAAAVVLLIAVVAGLRHLPGGTVKKAPLIDKSLPDFVTEDYLSVNSWSRPGIASGEITGIVIHYTASPGATGKEIRDYFESLAQSHETRASSHFVIGLEGEIITCVPLGELAYASNSRNMDTVSIECCHPEEDGAFTEQTYASLLKLTRWLMERYELESGDVLRHYDVTGKLCPRYFVDHPDAWESFLEELNQPETSAAE